jgi:hypothetical protein
MPCDVLFCALSLFEWLAFAGGVLGSQKYVLAELLLCDFAEHISAEMGR